MVHGRRGLSDLRVQKERCNGGEGATGMKIEPIFSDICMYEEVKILDG